MNDLLKDKLKSYSFWVSLASAILLLVQTIGRPLGLVIDESTYMSIVNSVLGVFVVLGIISHPAQNLLKTSTTQHEEITENEKTNSKDENAKNDDYVAKNSGNTAENCGIVAKNFTSSSENEGLVIDSKSGCDGGEIDTSNNENSDLKDLSSERIQQAKQDFINLYK